MILASNIPIILTVPGGSFAETAAIASLDVTPPVSGKPIKISTVAQNTGNHHYKLDAVVTLRDSAGKEVAHQVVPHAGSSLLPGYQRQYVASLGLLDHVTGLPAGTYTAEATLRHADGDHCPQQSLTITYHTPRPDQRRLASPCTASRRQRASPG